MTPLSPLQVEREHDRSLSLLMALMLATLDFLTTTDGQNVAVASDCLAAEFTGSRPILEFPTWSSLSQRSLSSVISPRDGRKDFPASRACVPMPTLSTVLAHTDTRNQTIAPLDAAVGQGSQTSTTVNRASTTGSRTMKTKSRIPTVKISVPPHSGKRHTLRTWTTPIELEAQTGERPSVIIGPKDQHSISHTTGMNVFPPAPVTQSRRQPVDLSNPLRNVVPHPGYGDESTRMNSTTTLALHGGECAYGCP